MSALAGAALLLLTGGTAAAEREPREWTFEEAAKHWRPMVRAVQHVGIPGYSFQAAVLWDGSPVFGPLGFRELKVMQKEMAPLGDHLLHVAVGYGEPMRFVDRRGTRHPAIQRSLEDGRLPIPHVRTQEGRFLWDEMVFATLADRQPAEGLQPKADDVLAVCTRFRVQNTGDQAGLARLWLHFGDTSDVQFGYKCTVTPEPGPAIAHRLDGPFGLLGDRVRFVIPPPGHGKMVWHEKLTNCQGVKGPLGRVIEWQVPLAPGAKADLWLVIPYGLVDRRVAKRLAALEFDARCAEIREFWQKLSAGRSQISTPDPFVNDYFAAVAGQMAQQVAYRRGSNVWMYKTSPNHYEGYWPCNAAKALPAFDLRGLTHLSRPVLGSFVDTQTDDVGGLCAERRKEKPANPPEGYERRPGFLGNFGEWTANTLLLSHGLELWALAAHYRITRDDRWLRDGPRPPLSAIVQACDWLAAQRRRTMREENGKKVGHWGLLPAASAHDWLSGNTIFNDAFCIYGMAEAVRMLREIGHPRAEEIAKELNDYRACLRQRYVEARDRARKVPQADGSQSPYVPRDVYELDWTKIDWTYTGYGPIRAGAWGALDPNDELVNQALAFLDKGMPKGLGPYFSAHQAFPDTADANWGDISDASAPRHFLWRHYVEYETMWPIGSHLFLARDDLPHFFEWLFHNLAAVLHREWRVGVESLDGVPSCAPGEGERWLAIRNMLVGERGGYDGSQQSLWLLQAVPRSWLKPGGRITASDMASYFGGRVDLDMAVANDGNSVTANAELRLAVSPKGVCIRLRSPDGRPLSRAEIIANDVIQLPAERTGKYHLVGYFGTLRALGASR
jgi:hypothetical protein